MKTFSEYLEEAVLQESKQLQIAVASHHLLTKHFAKFIQAGCELHLDKEDMGQMNHASQLYVPSIGEPILGVYYIKSDTDDAIYDVAFKTGAKFDKLTENISAVYVSVDPCNCYYEHPEYLKSNAFRSAVKKFVADLTKVLGIQPKKDGDDFFEFRLIDNAQILRDTKRAFDAQVKSIARNNRKVDAFNAKKDAQIAKAFGF